MSGRSLDHKAENGLKMDPRNAYKYGMRRKKSLMTAKIKRLWDLRGEMDYRILWLLWMAGACFLGTSIFATKMPPRFPQKTVRKQFEIGTSYEDVTLTIYTAPAPFEGDVGIRQEAAIDSWLRLKPCPNVVLLGQHSSVHAFASIRQPHVVVNSDIDFTFLGRPFFHAMVQRARSSDADIVMLIDPDVVLLRHVFLALKSLQQLNQDWLLAALPLNVPGFRFSVNGDGFARAGVHLDDKESGLESLSGRQREASGGILKKNGVWDTCEGARVWAWNGNRKPLHAGVMPPFVYGEGQHNHWLLAEALTSKYRIVLDASDAISAFRTQDNSQGASSTSLASKTQSDEGLSFGGNSWLASTYGSYYFRPLKNFSNVEVKLLKYGSFQTEKFCMVNTVQHPWNCSPLNTPKVSDKQLNPGNLKGAWPLWYYAPTWTSWFEHISSHTGKGVSGSWYVAGSNSHGHLYSWVEEMTMIQSEKKQTTNCSFITVPTYCNSQCLDSKLVGSEISKIELYSLEWLVESVANEHRVVILAVVGNSYRDMLMSWVCRLRHLHISNFLVGALDDDIYHFAALQGLPVFRNRLDIDVSRNDCHFGTECFQKVTKMKSRTVLQILQLGFHVLFSDVDVYWFQDPLSELMSFGPAHLTAQTDQWNETEPLNQPRRLNSGFYFAWADHQTVAAFEQIVKHAATSNLSEQPSFYDVLCGRNGEYRVGNDICMQPHLNMTVHFLDPVKYPNGAFRSLWFKANVRSLCLAQGCRVLHNNWVPGRRKKLDRQIASGLWDYDTSTRMCLRRDKS